MATYNLRRFSNPETLKHIAREHLLSLLSPHEEYFAKRGMTLPRSSSRDSLDYEGLVGILMTPDTGTPKEMAEALFFINEMATAEGMACLLEEAERLGIAITGVPAPSPADVAVQVWLHDRDALEQKHAEQFLTKKRSFEYFQTDTWPIPKFKKPSKATLKALTTDLNNWFDRKRRGRNCRVFAYPKEDGVWFLVRHGDPFKREAAIGENGQSVGVYYWPERFDVLVYKRATGEIGIQTQTKGELKLYRTMFGRHFFGADDFFSVDRKYTLEPLREQGEAALVCADIEGMEAAVLTEVHFCWGGAEHEKEIRQADDVFAAYGRREASFPTKAPIVKAKFHVAFSDAKKPRTVTVRPPNVAQYVRDDDSVIIERWLTERGFIMSQEPQERESAA